MRKLVLAIGVCIVCSGIAFAESFAPNQVLIQVRVPLSVSTPPAVLSQLPSFNAYSISVIPTKNPRNYFTYRLIFSDSIDVYETVRALNQSPEIVWAKPNYVYQVVQVQPGDPFSNEQGYLDQVNLPDAWAITSGNASVVVAVIDTGVLMTHDDLKNKIWTNPNEVPNNGVDDDANGYVDDVNGWDFVNQQPRSIEVINLEDYLIEDNDPTDFMGHGTEVAGVVAAEHLNSRGIKGVGGYTRVMPLRAGYAIAAGSGIEGGFDTVGLYNAILYAVDNGAQIINLSLGGNEDSCTEFCLEDAVDYAISKNVIVVAAAGNNAENIENSRFVPAIYPGVLTVSSVTSQNVFSSRFSNFGLNIAVAAPGESILSTGFIPSKFSMPQTNEYVVASGTSLSAPIVSGIAALILAKYPSKNANAVKAAIIGSAQGNGTHSLQLGYGVVDALGAVAYYDTELPTISHIPITEANEDSPITVSATVEDNLSELIPSKAFVKFREYIGGTITEWQTVTMNRSGSSFSYAITPSRTTEKLDYYLIAKDSNPTHNVILPTSGVFQVTIKDLSGPTVTSRKSTGDFVQTGETVTVSIQDISGVASESIVIRINDQLVTYTYQDNGTLSFQIPESLAESSADVEVTVQDDLGNVMVYELSLVTSTSDTKLTITGPSGSGPILTYPNPFNPDITSTKICFQSTRAGDIVVTIYDRYLGQITTFSEPILVGYNEIEWNGKTSFGSRVPSGVYFGILAVTSDDGQTTVKRLKMAVK